MSPSFMSVAADFAVIGFMAAILWRLIVLAEAFQQLRRRVDQLDVVKGVVDDVHRRDQARTLYLSGQTIPFIASRLDCTEIAVCQMLHGVECG